MNESEKNIKENFEYKAEMKQLLNIIIHSLYTHPEVFMRELVSNASDALNKLRFRRLTDSNILSPELELSIRISLDKENMTFTIEDTGIGMAREDLIDKIGTVASSGTIEFLKNLKDEQKSLDGQLIGQFGVGFYSVFMVTEQITIDTRSVDPEGKSYRWQSEGDDKFTIEEIEERQRGTRIYFKLREDYKQYCDEFQVKSVLKKYSNFVDFPLFVGDEEINKVTALWHRKKDDIKVEEYNEFYKYLTNDFEEPLGHLHLAIEGNINFKALLFVPQTAPPSFFRETSDKSLHLYSKKIFIQDDAKELLPDYLKFVRGIVDTEDLPLNVSREVTQSSPLMTKIKNVLTGKILTLFEEWAVNDKTKYEKFFKNFGSLFKTGVNSDFSNKDRIVELYRFESSALPKGELTSLKEYCSRMKENQKEIYYISGDTRDSIMKNPNIEYFIAQNLETLFITDPVDIFTIPYLHVYDGKSLKSIEKADVQISDESQQSRDRINPEMATSLIALFKETLGVQVEDVIESKRLVESAATLVVGQQGLDVQMEKMMQYLDKEFTVSKRILELNTSHPLIKNLSTMLIADASNPVLLRSIWQIYEGALLIEGHIKNPSEFVARMTEFMTEATN
ncbi:MAG: heat shock protein Hsp90 [Ignavibacteria bacterium]|nr:heat shock protein Hsp90 [Ignavibacteria bacterium]